MKQNRKMWIAFLLNGFFALFEFVGGLFTGSIAIASDALHDLGDALSIGLSLGLERRSRNTATIIIIKKDLPVGRSFHLCHF